MNMTRKYQIIAAAKTRGESMLDCYSKMMLRGYQYSWDEFIKMWNYVREC